MKASFMGPFQSEWQFSCHFRKIVLRKENKNKKLAGLLLPAPWLLLGDTLPTSCSRATHSCIVGLLPDNYSILQPSNGPRSARSAQFSSWGHSGGVLSVYILENTNIFQAVFCLRFQHGTHGYTNETAAAALTESLQACKPKTFASIFGKPQKLHRFLEVMLFFLLFFFVFFSLFFLAFSSSLSGQYDWIGCTI